MLWYLISQRRPQQGCLSCLPVLSSSISWDNCISGGWCSWQFSVVTVNLTSVSCLIQIYSSCTSIHFPPYFLWAEISFLESCFCRSVSVGAATQSEMLILFDLCCLCWVHRSWGSFLTLDLAAAVLYELGVHEQGRLWGKWLVASHFMLSMIKQ